MHGKMMINIVAPVLFIYEDWHLSLKSIQNKMNFCFKTLIIFALGKSHYTQIKVCAMKRKDDTIIATSD